MSITAFLTYIHCNASVWVVCVHVMSLVDGSVTPRQPLMWFVYLVKKP